MDDSLVGTLSDVEGVLQPSFRHPAEYRALSPEQCQCLAVKASSEGNSLAAERRALLATASHHGLTQEERLKVQVLWASELEARNRSAAAALTTYYHIAQAEANRPILARSLHELDDALANVARMRAQGMQIPFDDGELERQRLGVLDRQLKLISQLDQLNAELVQRLGLSTAEVRPRIWPTADFTVNVAPTDIDLAVGVGISSRPELQLLRSLKSSLKARNVAVTRDVVGGAGALIGSQSKFTGMVSLLRVRELIGQCCSNHRELPTRQRQLAEYYDRRQREVTTEIQQAVLEVESSLRRIAVEKQAVIAWRTEIDRLAKKSQIDQATFLDSSRARLKRLQAESDEIEQIIAWKIALVKVKEGQGMLVNECLANGCKFLDYPVVHETGGGPLSELIVPEDPLPEPEGNESDGPSLSPPAAEAEGILPPMLPRPPTSRRSIVMRLLQPKEDDAESAPPDVAVEPPSPPEDRTGSAPE
ncbi:MAG TPA: hypothetical protein VHC22_26025 [Pirellulales bacterium]|nr:hypothetical protein [Pirellulales bacterium]